MFGTTFIKDFLCVRFHDLYFFNLAELFAGTFCDCFGSMTKLSNRRYAMVVGQELSKVDFASVGALLGFPVDGGGGANRPL